MGGVTFDELKESPSLIEGFLKLYEDKYGEEVCQGCPGELQKAFIKYNQNMFNLNPTRMESKCSYRLQEKHRGGIRFHNGGAITDANLTDAKVAEKIAEFPIMAKTHFEMADGTPYKAPAVKKEVAKNPEPKKEPKAEPVVVKEEVKEEAPAEDAPVEEPKADLVIDWNAAPSTIKYAAKRNIDLSTINGTGENGRILLKDLKK